MYVCGYDLVESVWSNVIGLKKIWNSGECMWLGREENVVTVRIRWSFVYG